MAIAFNNQNNSIGLGSTNSLGFTTSITINSTGVGIGTTNPTQRLDVLGSARVTGAIYDSTNASGTSGQVFQSTATGTLWATPAGYQFNVGIKSAVFTQLTGVGSNVLTLPSTSAREYIIHSINASNVAVGNTEVNVTGAFDISGGERSYFAYNIPIPAGTSIELLKQPQVLGPSDIISMRGADYNRTGSDNAVQIYISYEVKTDINYFGVGLGTVGIATTNPTTVYASTTYPSVIQSIRLANRTDSGGYPVSVTITSGVTTTYLVSELVVPKYSNVEILDTPKALNTNDTVQVIVDQTQTIDFQLSGIRVVT